MNIRFKTERVPLHSIDTRYDFFFRRRHLRRKDITFIGNVDLAIQLLLGKLNRNLYNSVAGDLHLFLVLIGSGNLPMFTYRLCRTAQLLKENNRQVGVDIVGMRSAGPKPEVLTCIMLELLQSLDVIRSPSRVQILVDDFIEIILQNRHNRVSYNRIRV